jgi:hypothetical protein
MTCGLCIMSFHTSVAVIPIEQRLGVAAWSDTLWGAENRHYRGRHLAFGCVGLRRAPSGPEACMKGRPLCQQRSACAGGILPMAHDSEGRRVTLRDVRLPLGCGERRVTLLLPCWPRPGSTAPRVASISPVHPSTVLLETVSHVWQGCPAEVSQPARKWHYGC